MLNSYLLLISAKVIFLWNYITELFTVVILFRNSYFISDSKYLHIWYVCTVLEMM